MGKVKEIVNIDALRSDLMLKNPDFQFMNVTERMRAVRVYKNQLLNQALNENRNEIKELFVPELFGEAIQLVMAVLRFRYGFGEKRLAKFLHELNSFGDMMKRDGVDIPQLTDQIKEETGFDILKEFKKCETESTLAEERYKLRKREMTNGKG